MAYDENAAVQEAHPSPPDLQAQASLAHVIFNGQSLSVGFMGVPALSTEPAPLAYSFTTGVRSMDGMCHEAVDGAPDPFTQLIPLRETDAGPFGETPATACAVMLHQLLREENGLELEDIPSRLFLSAVGANEMHIEGLVDPYGFQPLKLSTLYGVQAARGLNRRYGLSALCLIQGESDYDRGTDPAVYARKVLDLQAMTAAIKAGMNPRACAVPLLLTQTITHLAYKCDRPSIALAQLKLAEADSAALVCVPTALPFWPHDVHLAAAGYQWMGAYYGVALKRWLWDGVKPKHLRPLQARADGHAIEVVFEVPKEPLVIDTVAVPAQPSSGFSVVDGDGREAEIIGASLAGPSAVRLELRDPAPGGSQVRYGWRGDGTKGLGNLRDAAGDLLQYRGEGYTLPLHNWAPIFELDLQ